MAFRARQSKGVSWAAAAKTEATDVCQRCSPGDTGTVGCGYGKDKDDASWFGGKMSSTAFREQWQCEMLPAVPLSLEIIPTGPCLSNRCFFFFMCFVSFFFFLLFIGVQLIYNVVLVSGVEQSESAIHIHISSLFQMLFPYQSLQSIEQSSLCSTVGPSQLSILYIVMCICQSSRSFKISTCISFTYSLSAFQTAVSRLGPGASESACKPFDRCFSVCYSPLGLVEASPFGSQRQMFGGFVSQVQVLKVGVPSREYEPFPLQREALGL